jgi:hypothetical protein
MVCQLYQVTENIFRSRDSIASGASEVINWVFRMKKASRGQYVLKFPLQGKSKPLIKLILKPEVLSTES